MLVIPQNSTPAPRAIAEQIPVYRPDLSGNERRYVLECVDSSWISSIGTFIERFESSIATLTGAPHAISVSNGTVALHLALHCLGIGPGDEVIVPTFTYIASVNTIAQTGATPVFADSRSDDWLMDVADVERRITERTKAIMAVHLYGAPCDMVGLKQLAERYNLKIVEDCAEALGTSLVGQHVGTFGDIGTFSFFGNKTITCGEGGMVIARDSALAVLLRMTKGQGQSLTKRYWHEVLGFNYRMTNIAAAIGFAQMERFRAIVKRKRALAAFYRSLLAATPVSFQRIGADVTSADWLVTLLLPQHANRDRIMEMMKEDGVETRPCFYCAHTMPMYARGESFPVAENIAQRGISLPSYPQLANDDVRRVCDSLVKALEKDAGSP
jgi:perosamine synthetase